MKKVLSIILALTMFFALGITAFAYDSDITNEQNQDVTADYNGLTDPTVAKVVSYTLGWALKSETTNTLQYTNGKTTYVWDAANTKYVKSTAEGANVEAGWSGSATYTLNITNNSNAPLTVTAAAAQSPVSFKTAVSTGSANVESAAKDVTKAENATGSQKTGSIDMTIDGSNLNGAISASDTIVAKLTVTVESGTQD